MTSYLEATLAVYDALQPTRKGLCVLEQRFSLIIPLMIRRAGIVSGVFQSSGEAEALLSILYSLTMDLYPGFH